MLDAGEVVERGTHEALIELDQHYARLWNMQIRSSGALPLTESWEFKSSHSLTTLDNSVVMEDNNNNNNDANNDVENV